MQVFCTVFKSDVSTVVEETLMIKNAASHSDMILPYITDYSVVHVCMRCK
jgi:hypothetical protein